jgi:hypothetical protein
VPTPIERIQRQIRDARATVKTQQQEVDRVSKELRSQNVIRNLSLLDRQAAEREVARGQEVLAARRAEIEAAQGQVDEFKTRQATFQGALQRVQRALQRGAGSAVREGDPPELRAEIERISEAVNLRKAGVKEVIDPESGLPVSARAAAAADLARQGISPQDATTILREGAQTVALPGTGEIVYQTNITGKLIKPGQSLVQPRQTFVPDIMFEKPEVLAARRGITGFVNPLPQPTVSAVTIGPERIGGQFVGSFPDQTPLQEGQLFTPAPNAFGGIPSGPFQNFTPAPPSLTPIPTPTEEALR